MAWSGVGLELKAEAYRLKQELESQRDISDILATQSGEFIASALRLAKSREYALMNRISLYEKASETAHSASQAITDAKTDMVSTVRNAEETIKTSRENARKAEDAVRGTPAGPAAIAAIEAQLQIAEAAAVTAAKEDAELRDATGASIVGGYSAAIQNWNDPFINGLLGEALPQAPAPAPIPVTPAGMGNGPMSPAPLDNNMAKPIDYGSAASDMKDAGKNKQSALENATDQKSGAEKNVQQAALRTEAKDALASPKEPAKPSMPSSPATSSPSTSSGGSSGGSPASAIGSMMKPMTSSPASSSSGSSPASSSSGMGGSSAASAGAHPASLSGAGGAPGGASAAGATGSGAAGAGGRGLGAISSGASAAESALRMGTGAVSAAANVVGTGGNIASQVAQGVANASAGAAPAGPASAGPAGVTSPAGVAGGGGAPMGMMAPPAAAASGGGGVVNPVGSPVSGSPSAVASGGGAAGLTSAPASSSASAGGGSTVVPAVVQGSPMRALAAADGGGGDAVAAASEASREILESVISQIRGLGLLNATWWSAAVSVFLERDGGATAWLATSDGPSYVPLGVRLPNDVDLAVRDPFIGRDLWERSATAGWSDPMEVLKYHAEARMDASPGTRPLVMAATWSMDRVQDWASQVGARAVSVDARTVEAGSAGGAGQHRTAVASPWDWQQANVLGVDERMGLAPQLAANAAMSGSLSTPACRLAIDLAGQGAELTASDWADVERDYQQASSAFDLSKSGISLTGGDAQAPEWTFRTARAAEAVLCLRNSSTVEGFADLLYASRLAGAPLGVMA